MDVLWDDWQLSQRADESLPAQDVGEPVHAEGAAIPKGVFGIMVQRGLDGMAGGEEEVVGRW